MKSMKVVCGFKLAAIASGVFAGSVAFASAGSELDEVLAGVREASGRAAWAQLGSDLRFTGEAQIAGVESDFTLFFGGDGAFRFETDGPLGNTAAWDGETVWSLDNGASSRELDGDARGRMLISQWVHSGYWADPSAPMEIELIEQAADTIELALALKDSSSRARLIIDATAMLPKELHQHAVGGDGMLEFANFTEFEGVLIAHEVTYSSVQSSAGGFLKIREAEAASARVDERYNLFGQGTGDARFDRDVPAEIEIRRVTSGHLIVNAAVNESRPRWFILDSGAGKMCIDPVLADELELPEFGSVPAAGIAGTVMASYRQGTTFKLGPLEMREPVFVELDLSFLEEYFGVPVYGICGYELFARSIVELDLKGPKAFLHDPKTFELQSAAWQPLVLENRIPSLECSFEGDRTGWFRIDTGDAGTVVFDTATVKSLDLLAERAVTTTMVGGVGGMAEARTGELEWFELGGRRFDAPAAVFHLHEDGSLPGDSTLGTVGSQFFQPFRVLFDYSGQRIGLVARSIR